ncbi:MAG: hypothetical protein Q9227_006695 [Pyrenula ochraceoflavens]
MSVATKAPHEIALERIDAGHNQDPNRVTTPSNSTLPYEIHYAQRCTHFLYELWSDKNTPPSIPLLLAIRAQHFRRWEVPRSSFPEGRSGYLRWRSHLKSRQAGMVKDLCLEAGMETAEAEKVAALMRKEGLGKSDQADNEVQILEDVACLVFLDDQFEEFEAKGGMDDDKVVSILRKTWGKMSERGREEAVKVAGKLGDRARQLVEKAVGEGAKEPTLEKVES